MPTGCLSATGPWPYGKAGKPPALQKVIDTAKQTMQGAAHMWARCKGSGAAYLLMCQRLGWEVIDAKLVKTDLGEVLDLRLDPPAVILQHCDDAGI